MPSSFLWYKLPKYGNQRKGMPCIKYFFLFPVNLQSIFIFLQRFETIKIFTSLTAYI